MWNRQAIARLSVIAILGTAVLDGAELPGPMIHHPRHFSFMACHLLYRTVMDARMAPFLLARRVSEGDP